MRNTQTDSHIYLGMAKQLIKKNYHHISAFKTITKKTNMYGKEILDKKKMLMDLNPFTKKNIKIKQQLLKS